MAYSFDTAGLPVSYTLQVDKALTANNTTASVNLFKLTGSVLIKKIYGVLTADTTLANMTAVSFDMNDATATVQLTKADGVMSTALVGAVIAKQASNATTASINLAATGTIMDGVNSGFYEFVATQKNSANTYIRFTYSTTDAPMAAAMRFFVEYESINGGSLAIA